MSILENIPKPVLWGGGALVVLLIVLRGRSREAPAASPLDATLASMQLAAASNIEALGITAQRDVALAQIYTDRMQLAEGSARTQERMGLEYLDRRMENRNSIRLAGMEHNTIRRGLNQQFQIRRIEERNERRSADQQFALARKWLNQNFYLDRKKLQQDFFLDKKYLPKMFELELQSLENQAEQQRFQYDIQTRRLDMMYMMGASQSGGAALGMRDPQTGAPTAAGAIGGAATGAMMGAAAGCMATGVFTFGLGCAASMAAGAAAGGGGGMS